MEAFFINVLRSLLIIALMTSSVVTERLHIENNGNSVHTLDTENKTKEDCNQDATGIRRVVSYDYSSPNKQCYTQFFVGGQPPVGLRAPNNGNIRYICQPPTPQPPGQPAQPTHYATMFDEFCGIAVFSAYTLTTRFQAYVSKRDPHPWCRTPGIWKQGSAAIYRNVQYERGHLVPAGTYSSSQERYDSTYTYTNAVPQSSGFNGGEWSQFEKRIRKYVETCTKSPSRQHGRPRPKQRGRPTRTPGQPPQLEGGTLYVITGTSFAEIRQQKNGILQQPNFPVEDNQIGTIKTGKIKVPYSLWTAGCCVHRHGQYTESFAVMGNNVETTDQASLTRQVTVKQLQNILAADVNKHHIGGPNVVLFPGDPNCLNNNLKNLPSPGVGR